MNPKTEGSLVFTGKKPSTKEKKSQKKSQRRKKQSSDTGRRNQFILDVNYLFMSNIVISKH